MLLLICINYLSVTHTYMHGDKVRHTGPFSLLSQVSPWWATTVQSLQTPCQPAPQAGGQAAWRQGPEAPVHTASHSRAARRLDHWAAGTGPWGWLLPWGDARGGEWHKDRQAETMQCLEYQTHWQVLLQTVGASLRVRPVKISQGARALCDVVSCELGRSWTPACTGSVKWVVGCEPSACLVTFALLQTVLAVVAGPLTQKVGPVCFLWESLQRGQSETESSGEMFWQEMGMDYQWANVEKQQGDFRVGGMRRGWGLGEGVIRSFGMQLNGTLKGLALSE